LPAGQVPDDLASPACRSTGDDAWTLAVLKHEVQDHDRGGEIKELYQPFATGGDPAIALE
jgi:hypothetical protein